MYKCKKHINSLISIVGENNVHLENLAKYNVDWLNKYTGHSEVVVTPNRIGQLSELMKYCYNNNIGVVPQGGNTGLVGGSVPVNDELVISMSKLTKIYEFDQTTSILTAQSGCILQNLQEFLLPYKYQMPWDIGARGSCQLGGNIATNAGGLNVVRYGVMRNYILGLEVVLPNGDVLNLMNKNRKDNTGYDLKQLFIGSEGTLGIITKANVLVVPTPQENQSFFMELDNYDQVIDVMKTAKSFESLNAFEFMEGFILKKSAELKHTTNTPFDFKEDKYYVLVEFAGQSLNLDAICEGLVKHTENIMQSTDEKSRNEFWNWREGIAEVLTKLGYTLKYDLSISPDKFDWFARQIYPERKERLNCYYGHVGDGNIHFNVVLNTMEELHQEEQRIEDRMMDLVRQMGGSISAEHGIGVHKRKYLGLQKGELQYNIMKKIKSQFDPKNIMNPGKLL